jgi:hypothetical protein
MNKKVFSGVIIGFLIVAGAIFNVSLNLHNNRLSAIALANFEALTGFEFNNQNWDSESHWYNVAGSSWNPVPIACTATETSMSFTIDTGGSINIFGTGLSWDGSIFQFGGGTTSYNGVMVQCQGGNGNCFNGTSCLGASIRN